MKAIVYIATSLDGFRRNDGDISWLTNYESQEVYDSFKEFISRIHASNR